MPDITMCNGQNCNKKNTCYRFTATPTPHWQSYFSVSPVVNDECDHYMKLKTSK
jgi:hypothetical protein